MNFSVKYFRTFQNCPKLSRLSGWYSPTSSFKVLLCLYFPISNGRKCFPGRVLTVCHSSLWHTVPSDIWWYRYFQETEDWPATLAVPLVLAFAPKAKKKRERKNGALVPCCTDISILHSYLNISYNIWFLRKQNIKCNLFDMNSVGGKELKSSPFREQTSQGREQEVWATETAGRVGKEIMMKSF